MNKNFKIIIGAIAFTILITISVLAYNSLSEKYKPDNEFDFDSNETNSATHGFDDDEEKYPAPDFSVFDSTGNEVKLSDFKGKPVVVNFWASWCPPCKSEMPDFDEVYAIVKDDIHFMMIDLVDGQRETQEIGQKYIDNQGFTFPVYFDNNQSAATTYGIMSIPTTLFITAEGNIITGYQGAIDKDVLLKGIQLIKGVKEA